MRVAHVNCDPGIAPGRSKGAAVHVEAVRRALARQGALVHAIDAGAERVRGLLESAAATGGLDLVYERYALGAGAAQAFARDRGTPYVLEVNAPLIDEERQFRGREPGAEAQAVERRLFSQADLILAVSRPVAEYAVRGGAAPERVRVRPNAVDPERFDRKRSAELRARLFGPDAFVVGFHGRLRPWHGFARIAGAVADLRRRGLPARLLAVGTGDFEAEIDGCLDEQAVVLAGWQDHADVGRFVGCFDALPLAYERSGASYFSPLKLREAMAAGAVPVVPRVGDLPEVVEDGRTGLLVESGDRPALAAALERLASDPRLRARLSAAAQVEARRHTWDDIARELCEFARAEAAR